MLILVELGWVIIGWVKLG